MTSAKDIPVPTKRFQHEFGESWEVALRENRVCNALEACEAFSCTADELHEAWKRDDTKVVKFGGGFYCGLISMKGKRRYVFNGFFMSMRSKFIGKGASIHSFVVEFSPKTLSWVSFRSKVIGPTNPEIAPAGSLRRTIFDRYKSLGLNMQPTNSENSLHASASPFEGLAEKLNWLGMPIEEDMFGNTLLQTGFSDTIIRAWALDPRTKQPDGSIDSLFDVLEDLDADDCLSKMKALRSLNNDEASAVP